MRTSRLENSSMCHNQARTKIRRFSWLHGFAGKPKLNRILLLLTTGFLCVLSNNQSSFAAQPENIAPLELVEEMDIAAIDATSERDSSGATEKILSSARRPEGEFEDFNVVLARIEAEHARLAAMEQRIEIGSTDTLIDIPDSLNDNLPAVAEMSVESSVTEVARESKKNAAAILKNTTRDADSKYEGIALTSDIPQGEIEPDIELNPTPQPQGSTIITLENSSETIAIESEAGANIEIDLSEEAEAEAEIPTPISATSAGDQEEMKSDLSERAAEQIRRQRLLKKMRQVEAGRQTEAAEQLAEEGDHESALKLMEDAERLNPESVEIARRVRELRALVEKSGAQSIIESTLNRARIENSVSSMRINNQLDEAESMLVSARSGSDDDELLQPDERLNRARGQVMNALKALDNADALLEGAMVALPSRSEKRMKSAMLREELLTERSRIDEELRAISIERAQNEVAAAKNEYDESITRKIDSMMKSAEYHIERQEYQKAVEITEQIIKMYPNYKPVFSLRDRARTLNFSTREEDIQRRLEYAEEQASLDVNEMAIANSASIIYPEDWEELKLQRAVAVNVEASEEWKREIQQKLDSIRITLNFEATPLEEILAIVRERGELNLIPDSSVDVLQEVTITVNDMTLGPALDWVLDLCSPPLHREMRDEALYISTEPRSNVEIRLYPVFDITKAVNDYYGDAGFGETGETGDIFGDDDDDDGGGAGDQDQAEIINDIRDVIDGNWDTDLRVSIDVWNDQLLVIQTPQVHQRIEKYLQGIRATMKQQVLVEGRFLLVIENFIEEIGFAWTGPEPNTASAFPVGGDAGVFTGLSDIPSGIMSTSATSTRNIGYRALLSGLSVGQMADTFTDEGGINLAYKYISSDPLHAFEVNAILDAVRRNQKGSILHNPKLLVGNGRHAYMRIATISDYISTAEVDEGYVTPTIEQIEQGVVFNVRPVISFDKKYITVRLRPQMTEWDVENTINRTQTLFTRTQGGEDDDTDFGTVPVTIPFTLPAIKTTIIQTTVTIPTGGTILIGGHMSDDRTETVRGVPFLSDLPFIGRLTRHEKLERKKSNLILMIGAKIIELEQ